MNPINARTVRFWAWVDSAVTVTLALPPLAERFVALLYTVNGWMGGVSEAPTFGRSICCSSACSGRWSRCW